MVHLVKTTLCEIASLIDEMDLNERIIFSTEDPKMLEYYGLQPCKYNVICKLKLLHETHYAVTIGLVNGCCTVAKDINILSDGNVNDEDSRIEGIEAFLQEYYDNYMTKNSDNNVYLVVIV